MPCPDGCIRCDTQQNCLDNSCKTGYLYVDSSKECILCNKKCLNCFPDINTCTECKDNTRNLDTNCECNQHQYSLVLNETCD